MSERLPAAASRERLPNRRAHTLLNIEVGGFRYVAGVGHYGHGRLAEISLNSEKGGTAIDDAARDSAVVASIALQHGVDADTLRHALIRNGNGVASGPLGTLLDLLAKARG
jgi:ribonucleoside-diphosphate reductase alpha chain